MFTDSVSRMAARAAVGLCALVFTTGIWAADGATDERSYQVQPGDLLHVSVWKEPDLSQEVLVRPDGGLTFPLVGEVEADGRSVDDIRQAIAEQLTRYIPDPVVTVSVKEIRGNEIYVIGEVRAPGAFVAPRRLDVMQALSMAGGTTEYASLDEIIILRRDAETNDQTALDFPYSKVAAGQDLDRNILLRAGDVVVVP
ncbi:MAG: polysaccharide biosynthesis/export family protein [Gammaproteobacteria bacterium]|nr:polysaccharide biosynthesis/export family protein [Gammaproteobacteria bacterium]